MFDRIPFLRGLLWPLWVLPIIYVVGILGVSLDLHPMFIRLTPITLLISMWGLWAGYTGSQNKWWTIVIGGFIFGFVLEVIGVNTGFPFGRYAYGDVLGPKLLATPFMIGVNWAMLAIATHQTAGLVLKQRVLRVCLAAGLMTGLDFIMEPVAINTGMWHWFGQPIPWNNYAAWFFASLLLIGWMEWQEKPTSNINKVAPVLLLLQFLFFGVLNLLSR
jgi:bisanhydrobacterioruberin hydratase